MARTGRAFPARPFISSEWIQQFVQRTTVASAGVAQATANASPRVERPIRPVATATALSGTTATSSVALSGVASATATVYGSSQVVLTHAGRPIAIVTTRDATTSGAAGSSIAWVSGESFTWVSGETIDWVT